MARSEFRIYDDLILEPQIHGSDRHLRGPNSGDEIQEIAKAAGEILPPEMNQNTFGSRDQQGLQIFGVGYIHLGDRPFTLGDAFPASNKFLVKTEATSALPFGPRAIPARQDGKVKRRPQGRLQHDSRGIVRCSNLLQPRGCGSRIFQRPRQFQRIHH